MSGARMASIRRGSNATRRTAGRAQRGKPSLAIAPVELATGRETRGEGLEGAVGASIVMGLACAPSGVMAVSVIGEDFVTLHPSDGVESHIIRHRFTGVNANRRPSIQGD